jgi:hypothetical protein
MYDLQNAVEIGAKDATAQDGESIADVADGMAGKWLKRVIQIKMHTTFQTVVIP